MEHSSTSFFLVRLASGAPKHREAHQYGKTRRSVGLKHRLTLWPVAMAEVRRIELWILTKLSYAKQRGSAA